MFHPDTDSTKICTRIFSGQHSDSFITRKVRDGKIANDFKHVSYHSEPLFKAEHIRKILVIKGNGNNVYLSADLLTGNESGSFKVIAENPRSLVC